MGQKLVTLTDFRYAAQAEIAKVALEQAGIKALLQNTNISTASFGLGNSAGWPKIQVAEDDVEAALEVLKSDPRLIGEKSNPHSCANQSTCLSCGAPMSPKEIECKKCGWTFAIER